jgi:HEPN domain-containing protein
MSGTDTTWVYEWFYFGDMDWQSANLLLGIQGPRPIVAFHLQQAIEKYLKGYLLAQGWRLQRIHDLEILVQEAIQYDADFSPFVPDCQAIMAYYIGTRYPVGQFHEVIDKKRLEEDMAVTEKLITLIRHKVPPPSTES